jgi:beta-exotoxin I transport system permease protein
MLRSVAAKSVRDLRRGFVWWSVGLVAMVALMVAVYPTVRDNRALNKLVQQYPEALKAFIGFGGQVDYLSAAGYLGSELFSFMVPLVLLVAAIGAGARAVAGEEEAGTLELLLSCPVSRRRFVVEKLAALTVEVVGLGAVLLLSLWVGALAVSMEISFGHLAAATTAAVLLALAYGALALLVGAATGRRGLTAAVVAAAAVAAYLVASLAPLVRVLDPAKLASPFYHYSAGGPLLHGLAAGHALLLVAIAAVAGLLAPFALERRDVGVG